MRDVPAEVSDNLHETDPTVLTSKNVKDPCGH